MELVWISLLMFVGVCLYVFPKINITNKKKDIFIGLIISFVLSFIFVFFHSLEIEGVFWINLLNLWSLAFVIVFALGLYGLFRKELIPEINEEIILFSVIIAWYMILQDTLVLMLFSVPLSLITAGVLYACFTKKIVPFFLRLIFTLYYNFVLLIVVLYQLVLLSGIEIPFIQSTSEPGIIEFVLLGYLFMSLVISFLNIGGYIPGKKRTINDIKEHTRFLDKKYSSDQLSLKLFAIYLISAFVVLWTNYSYGLIDNILIVNFFLFLPYSFQYIRKKNYLEANIIMFCLFPVYYIKKCFNIIWSFVLILQIGPKTLSGLSVLLRCYVQRFEYLLVAELRFAINSDIVFSCSSGCFSSAAFSFATYPAWCIFIVLASICGSSASYS